MSLQDLMLDLNARASPEANAASAAGVVSMLELGQTKPHRSWKQSDVTDFLETAQDRLGPAGVVRPPLPTDLACLSS